MQEFFIPVILGTGREGRQSEKAAHVVLEELKKRESVETEFIDARDIAFCLTERESEKSEGWKELVIRADGFLIVSPEYNHGFPGELKIALDALYKEYKAKPVGLCGASDGPIGGARMIELLVPVLVTLGLSPVQRTLAVPKVDQAFDESGRFKDEGLYKRLNGLIDEVLWYAKVLKEGREKYPLP